MLKQKPKPPKRSNGKGSVTLRKDANRAKPYMVRTWVDGVGQTYIGDAESYEDGLLMLADFGNHPERYLKVISRLHLPKFITLFVTKPLKAANWTIPQSQITSHPLSTAAGYGISPYPLCVLPICSRLLPIHATAAATTMRRKKLER